jgi:hypothetical protein
MSELVEPSRGPTQKLIKHLPRPSRLFELFERPRHFCRLVWFARKRRRADIPRVQPFLSDTHSLYRISERHLKPTRHGIR